MHDIIIKTYELIDELDKSEIVKNIKESKEKLLKDRCFLRKIASIQENMTDKGKKELYNNKDYKIYMDNYYYLQLIILKINKQIKDITNNKEHNK